MASPNHHERTIRKILIANRGEIARRVIRTCRQMNINTVAVYSDADADAPFVREADETVHIGPAQAKSSYLDMDKIIEAALATGADAIHPGYGFLSENATFAEKCEQSGIIFIGPRAETIRLMGSKIEARKHMQQAGVPVVPGWDGHLESVEHALSVAEDLGYPLMLKASAGGGGIGMQRVENAEQLKKIFASTMQRAQSFFGDSTVFLEKWIEQPRHIEVQIACDRHGNVVHLFERECSVQRRNQKVIEESPSPFLDETQRKDLCETAVRGARQIGYENVGTMEFIFDGNSQNFYFLEMNTRLQVEHPVTEEITGLDLVEWQIRVAGGEPLPLSQNEVSKSGHAIECRLYAEDPRTFMPSPGTITTLTFPAQQEGVRFDLAVEEGSRVSPFYDPMIGKLIVHGRDRMQAIAKMEQVIAELQVKGITTNLELLAQVMQNHDFRRGEYSTQLLDRMTGGI